MIVLMKKNDANAVRGLKEMVEAAFRDLQTGAEQPDLGKRLRGCSTHRREARGASEHTGSWDMEPQARWSLHLPSLTPPTWQWPQHLPGQENIPLSYSPA